MWREKYNLNDDQEPEPQMIQPPLEREPQDPPDMYNPDGSGQWPPDRDFEVTMYFTVVRTDGERVRAIFPLVADGYNIGAFVEVLHNNGVPYSVVPIEHGDEEESEETDE